MSLKRLKTEYLRDIKSIYDEMIAETILPVENSDKAKITNKIAWKAVDQYLSSINCSPEERMVCIYCGIVINLQERHAFRPYEYMDLSRRIGELWQKFCAAAWSFSPSEDVVIYEPPEFDEIKAPLIDKIIEGQSAENIIRIKSLLTLIPNINLEEDVTYFKSNKLKIVDFKSGFGSNEKGNTHRLLIVANAYKFVEPDSECFLLVRQTDNNNYLNVLKSSGLWTVHMGSAAYKHMSKETDVDVEKVISACKDLRDDLNSETVDDLLRRIPSFAKYAVWA